MKLRVPPADDGALAFVGEHSLRFHKRGFKDGSAKCDAFATHDPNDCLYGVLYTINESDKARLDEIEGLGRGYNIKEVVASTSDGRRVEAWMYVADDTAIDESLKPKMWYVKYVLSGALEHRLPYEYILANIASALPLPPSKLF